MAYNWNWTVLVGEPYLGWILSGFAWTVAISSSAWIIAFIVGSVIGVMRTTPSAFLRAVGTGYVELFRNVPLLVQMFVWYFVVPELVPDEAGRWLKRDLPLPEHTTAVVCLGLYTAARVAEQVRSGIDAVGPGLRQAGSAIGLTIPQVYRYLLLPVSYRLIIPPLTSEFLNVFKNSSLALTIGVLELTAQARRIEEYTFQGFEAFTAATVLYMCVTLAVMTGMRVLERRTHVPGQISLETK